MSLLAFLNCESRQPQSSQLVDTRFQVERPRGCTASPFIAKNTQLKAIQCCFPITPVSRKGFQHSSHSGDLQTLGGSREHTNVRILIRLANSPLHLILALRLQKPFDLSNQTAPRRVRSRALPFRSASFVRRERSSRMARFSRTYA